jgi:hypothetical protein
VGHFENTTAKCSKGCTAKRKNRENDFSDFWLMPSNYC